MPGIAFDWAVSRKLGGVLDFGNQEKSPRGAVVAMTHATLCEGRGGPQCPCLVCPPSTGTGLRLYVEMAPPHTAADSNAQHVACRNVGPSNLFCNGRATSNTDQQQCFKHRHLGSIVYLTSGLFFLILAMWNEPSAIDMMRAPISLLIRCFVLSRLSMCRSRTDTLVVRV